jgi:hypothetical protein
VDKLGDADRLTDEVKLYIVAVATSVETEASY